MTSPDYLTKLGGPPPPPSEDELTAAIEAAVRTLPQYWSSRPTVSVYLPLPHAEPDSYRASLFDGHTYGDTFVVHGRGTKLRALHHLAEAVAVALATERDRATAAHDALARVLAPLRAELDATGESK